MNIILNSIFLAASNSAANQGIIQQFGISLTALLAQLLAFSIVFFILLKFAYKPILAMLEQRRKTIQDSEDQAAEISKKLENTEKRVQEILKEANDKSEKLLQEAKESSELLSNKQKQESITEATNIINKAKEAAISEKNNIMQELKQEFGSILINATSKVTGKVLDDSDHKKINQEASSQISI